MPLFFVKTPAYCSRHKYPLGTYFLLMESIHPRKKTFKVNLNFWIEVILEISG